MGFTVESMTAAWSPCSLPFRHLKDINQYTLDIKDKEYGGLAAVFDSTVKPITKIIFSFLDKALYL